MSLNDAQREEVRQQLAKAKVRPDRWDRFFDIAARLGLDSPEGTKRLLRTEVLSNRRFLLNLPETIDTNVSGVVAQAGVDRTAYIDLALQATSLFGTPAETVCQHIDGLGKLLSLDTQGVMHAAKLRPTVLTFSPASLQKNAEELAQLLGVKTPDILKVARRYMIILTLNPAVMNGKVEALAGLLGVGKPELVKAALKETSVLGQDPATIAGQVSDTALALGLEKTVYVASALKRPSMLSFTKDKIVSNVTGSAQLLGMSVAEFVPLALKQPPLFTMNPSMMDERVSKSCELLGTTREEFITAAKKMPPLLVMSPETLDRHASLLMRQYRAAGQEVTKAELLIQRPSNLCRADGALLGRFIVQQKELLPEATPSMIIRKPNSVIEGVVSEHYAGRLAAAQTPQQEAGITRTLQQLHRLKVIKELPEGVEPAAPRSR